MPDQLTILVNHLNPVQWNRVDFAFSIDDLESKTLVLLKVEILQRDSEDMIFHAVINRIYFET